MGFFDKVGKKFGLVDQDDTEDYEDKEMDMRDNDMTEGRDYSQRSERASQNVLDFHSAVSARDNVVAAKMKVVVIEPNSFDDSQEIANCLQDKRPVVVNMHKLDQAEERRIVDFISGTTYAMNGDIKRVGEHVYFCAPNNVNITYTDDDEKKPTDSELPWMKK